LAGAVPYTPAMKAKMKLAESSYIAERVTSHKPVYAPAIFPFDKTVVVAIVRESASFEVWFAANTCCGVTKQHRFVTKPHEFVAKRHEFVAKRHEFVTKPHELITKPHELVTKKHSFLTKKLGFVEKHLQTSTVK
jgi:hypothetical protein